MKRYEFSEQAEKEILDTVAYISEDNPIAAENWLDRIEDVCFKLAEFSFDGARTPGAFRRSAFLSSWPIFDFLPTTRNGSVCCSCVAWSNGY